MPKLKKRYIVDFPGHIADCECNYRRLRKLMYGWTSFSDDENSDCLIKSNDISCANEWRYIIGNKKGNNRNSEMAVTITVQEKARYTTTVHIVVYTQLQNQTSWVTYNSSEGKINQTESLSEEGHKYSGLSLEATLAPAKVRLNGCEAHSLDVRLYHDASVAEVIACQGYRRFLVRHEYPNRHMHHQDEKSQLNKFLGELLAFCLISGRVMQDIVTVP